MVQLTSLQVISLDWFAFVKLFKAREYFHDADYSLLQPKPHCSFSVELYKQVLYDFFQDGRDAETISMVCFIAEAIRVRCSLEQPALLALPEGWSLRTS